MTTAAISPGRRREQRATELSLIKRNLRQTQEVKKELQNLRRELDGVIQRTKDPHTAAELKEIQKGTLARLEALEGEDEDVQGTQAAIFDLKVRQEKGAPIGRR